MTDEKGRIVIPVKTTEDTFGKKNYDFPKNAKHKKASPSVYVMWTLLALIVGFSVPYFLIDLSLTIFRKTEAVSVIPEESFRTPVPEPQLGSNDSETDEETSTVPGTYYFLGPDYKAPKTSAAAYIVADVDTGEVIIEKSADVVYPIASISKLITALVSKDFLNQHEQVTVSRSSIETYGTYGGLRVGEKILANDLLYPLLIESSNDAAEVLAQGKDREEFMKRMNDKAKELGMENTAFEEPSGLSYKNVSTAKDLLKLARYISKEKPEVWDITRIKQFAILKHYWTNGNRLMQRSNFIGGKNGYTEEAHNTTVSVFEVSVEGYKRNLAVVILKSDDRVGDVDKLLRFVSDWVGFLPEGEVID